MAAGIIPGPDKPLGPCPNTCQHQDCAISRRMASDACPFCEWPIGYDTRFYEIENGVLVHADCYDKEIEKANAVRRN